MFTSYIPWPDSFPDSVCTHCTLNQTELGEWIDKRFLYDIYLYTLYVT